MKQALKLGAPLVLLSIIITKCINDSTILNHYSTQILIIFLVFVLAYNLSKDFFNSKYTKIGMICLSMLSFGLYFFKQTNIFLSISVSLILFVLLSILIQNGSKHLRLGSK